MKPSAIPQRAFTRALSILYMVTLAAGTLAAGCGGTFDEGGGDPPALDMDGPLAADMVGPAGGTVTPRGSAANAADAKVEVPPGALTAATASAIEEGSTGAPALAGGAHGARRHVRAHAS